MLPIFHALFMSLFDVIRVITSRRMGCTGGCGTYGGEEKCVQGFGGKTDEKRLLGRHLLTYLLTYLLTPWSRVLLEKLTGSAASQEIPRIFGTRRFITVLTSARHLSLS